MTALCKARVINGLSFASTIVNFPWLSLAEESEVSTQARSTVDR